MSERAFEPDGISTFDVIIIGAGVSGLCLAKTWLASTTPFRSILVIDGARDDDQLRTLSFWSSGTSIFEPLVKHAWKRLELVDDSGRHEIPLEKTTYRTLFWADLQREVLAEVRQSPRSKVLEGRASEVIDHGDCVKVVVAGQTYRGRWAMDSRFRLADLVIDTKHWHPLRQYFTGWLLRAKAGSFNPNAATLFDFRVGLAPGRAFFYVLPFSSEEALVELVTLDREEAGPLIERYVREILQIKDFEVIAKEHGISPMTEQPFRSLASARVRRLGIAAGMLKPSTGYAFTRIEGDCRAIVDSLVRHSDPMVSAQASALYRFLDGVLLELWERTPALLPGIFRLLFLRNPADRVLWFLDENIGLWSLAKLIWTLPFLPFLESAFRWIFRRFFGRRARLPEGERPL